MKIAVTGSTGLVGEPLVTYLEKNGHGVTRIVRQQPSNSSVRWDPEKNEIDAEQLEGFDAVVHLAGENIASRRWTAEQKARIRDSRVQGTSLLSHALAARTAKPRVLISASATGFYGDRGDFVCDESTSSGDNFLAEVCEAWEAATEPAERAGIRVVHVRTGVVLSRHGGALQKMLLPFKMGVGGVVGNGRQYMSWIAIDDLILAIDYCLRHEELSGPVNAVSPDPVTNHEFTKTLGRVIRRPTILPMPAFGARFLFGEMADALLLASCRVAPKRLLDSGFTFQYPDLESALRHVLGYDA